MTARRFAICLSILLALPALTGCAAAGLPGALAAEGLSPDRAVESLRGLLPATVNYDDPDGPLYAGQYAPLHRPPPEELVVVTYNLRYAEAIDDAIAAFQTQAPLPEAGFILLQEMDAAGTEALAAALGYDYVYFPASVAEDGDDFGNAILSRWPLREPRKIILPGLHPLTGQQRTATRVTARVGDTDVLLYSVHIEIATAPPALRTEQMAAVLADVPPEAERVIIGGDFNVVTGEGVATLAEQYVAGELDHATPGLGPTLARFGLRPSAADHLFTRGFAVLEAGVLGEVTASDHFPVWARLR